MNNLSWLIYLAEVSGSLSHFMVLLAFLGGVGAFVTAFPLIISRYVMAENAPKGDQEPGSTFREARGVYQTTRPWATLAWTLFIGGALIAILTPGKTTVLAIAASELGERVATSQPGQELSQEALAALKGVLKKLSGEDEKKSK